MASIYNSILMLLLIKENLQILGGAKSQGQAKDDSYINNSSSGIVC